MILFIVIGILFFVHRIATSFSPIGISLLIIGVIMVTINKRGALKLKKERKINSVFIKSVKVKCSYKQHQIMVLLQLDQAFYPP